MTPVELVADCALCAALCCIGPGFARSADFPIDKPAGTPCPNLAPDRRCTVHDTLREKGFRGCVSYDCFGAGQRLVAGARAVDADVLAALPVLRLLHELLWYLEDVLDRPSAAPVHGAARAAHATTSRLADRPAAALAVLDAEPHRREVAGLLRTASDAVRSAGRPELSGKDLSGKDLSGKDLSGRDMRRADLRRSCLRGVLLLEADLRDADLSTADLLGADTRGARLDGADLSGALYLTRSQLDAATGRPGGLPDRLARLVSPTGS